MFNNIEFIKFEYNAPYIYDEINVGTNKVEDLIDRSLLKGIVAISPGWILIELNKEWEFEDIEIGGYNGNPNAFAPTNGGGANILTSNNKINWVTVGILPHNYGSFVTSVRITKSSAKYIKFVSNSYLGIGFLEIKKLKQSK